MENEVNIAAALKRILLISLIPVLILIGIIGAIYIWNDINKRHFERGATRISAIVTEVTYQKEQRRTYHRSGRRSHYVTYGPKYTRTNIDYSYTIGTEKYDKSTFFDTKLFITAGDSIRIEYANDKPGLSRVIENRHGYPLIRRAKSEEPERKVGRGILKMEQATKKKVSE